MGTVTNRTGQTSRGDLGLSVWNDSRFTYSITQLLTGTNPNSKLEIVSGLNFSNYGVQSFYFNYHYSHSRFYPKLYLGTLQSVSESWTSDVQDPKKVDSKWAEAGNQKSGSLLIILF